MATRMIKVRRKALLALFIAVAFLIIIIYNLSKTEDALQQDVNRSSDKEFQKYLRSCSKQSQIEHVSFHEKEASDFGQGDTENQLENDRDFAKYSKYPTAEPGIGYEQTTKVKALSSQSLSNVDDILNNITFANLMHVSENDGVNKSQFLNWTNTYMLVHHKNSFQMPEWFVRGSEICNDDTEMIIIMPSVPEHDFTRELIRQTWASSLYGMQFPQIRPASLRIKLAFMLGTSELPDFKKAVLKREAEIYHDIVAADFVDSYRNLTLKMMVSLNWVSKFCSGVKYVMKTDLDTFVNIPLLSRFLLEISKKVPRFIIGHKHGIRRPPVLRHGKWGVKKEDYPFDHFPPYLFGHSYVISGELVPAFVNAGNHLPLIPTEDAHITGVLARVIQTPRLHYKGFAHLYKKVLPCRVIYNYDISVTKMSASRLILMWRDMLTETCSDRELPVRSNSITKSEYDSMMKEDKEFDDANKTAEISERVEKNETVLTNKKIKEASKHISDIAKSVWKYFSKF